MKTNSLIYVMFISLVLLYSCVTSTSTTSGDDVASEFESGEDFTGNINEKVKTNEGDSLYFTYKDGETTVLIGDNDAGFSIDGMSDELTNIYGSGANAKGVFTVKGFASATKGLDEWNGIIGKEFAVSFTHGDLSSSDDTKCKISAFKAGEISDFMGTKYCLTATFTGKVVATDGTLSEITDGKVVLFTYKK